MTKITKWPIHRHKITNTDDVLRMYSSLSSFFFFVDTTNKKVVHPIDLLSSTNHFSPHLLLATVPLRHRINLSPSAADTEFLSRSLRKESSRLSNLLQDGLGTSAEREDPGEVSCGRSGGR